MTPQSDFHEVVFEAVPTPMFIVDQDLCVIDFNAAAARMSEPLVMAALRPTTGNVLQCADMDGARCGQAPACRSCMIRKSVREAYAGGEVHRKAVRLTVQKHGLSTEADFLVTTAPFRDRAKRLVLLILENLAEIDALRKQPWVEGNCCVRAIAGD